MKLICRLFGHKWKYNFTLIPNKRICKRCGEKEIGKFNINFHNPLNDDLFIWEKYKN